MISAARSPFCRTMACRLRPSAASIAGINFGSTSSCATSEPTPRRWKRRIVQSFSTACEPSSQAFAFFVELRRISRRDFFSASVRSNSPRVSLLEFRATFVAAAANLSPPAADSRGEIVESLLLALDRLRARCDPVTDSLRAHASSFSCNLAASSRKLPSVARGGQSSRTIHLPASPIRLSICVESEALHALFSHPVRSVARIPRVLRQLCQARSRFAGRSAFVFAINASVSCIWRIAGCAFVFGRGDIAFGAFDQLAEFPGPFPIELDPAAMRR